MVEQFDRSETVSLAPSYTNQVDFLLGSPPSVRDILDGRVVRREVLDKDILPAIRGTLEGGEHTFRAIVITGRAGAGVTTLLCLAANHISTHQWAPVFAALRAGGRRLEEWKDAGDLLAEISRATKCPVVLFLDALDASWRELEVLLESAIEQGGEIVPIVGGRRELVKLLISDESTAQAIQRIDISDSLSENEWKSLARILQQNGFSTSVPNPTLAKQLSSVGQLLPAIYQATDRMNRKFRDIVSYEYHRYDADALIQRAYRLVCYLGAFGLSITQVWLLKALGNQSLATSSYILGKLSDDIVVYENENSEGEFVISPRHRLIAEEVLNIAVPDPAHRLIDLRELVATANLASASEGARVAQLLLRRSDLISWVQTTFPDKGTQYETLSKLYETALENQPIYRGTELTIRQHYALVLRYYRLYDEALEQIMKAIALEPSNPATTHIAGLIHVSRALAAWKIYADDRAEGQDVFSQALSNEQDALEFFRKVRYQQPLEEYGYDSEARYFRLKVKALGTGGGSSNLEAVRRESNLQALGALALLRVAEETIPGTLEEIPKTKAYLLNMVGDKAAAQRILEDEIEKSRDPIKTIRLMRAASTLAIESGNWSLASRLCKELIRRGEHDASIYLMLDRAHIALGVDIQDRLRWVRESAQHWNRRDIETLVRFADLLLYADDWTAAIRALETADEVAKGNLSIMQRDRIRGTLKEKDPYSGKERRLEGQVLRMSKPYEGFVLLPGLLTGVFFRIPREYKGTLAPGQMVSYVLAWRIRGLRAIRLEAVEAE